MKPGDRVWLIHDSGAFGAEYVPLLVRSVGPTGFYVTVEAAPRRGGRVFRARPGNLRPASDPEWTEEWEGASC
jgi:hypothetical protein